MEFLLGAICVLAAITVVGHGLWVLCATVFHALGGQDKPRGACPRCGFTLQAGDCAVCHWPLTIPPQPRHKKAALDALRAQVDTLAKLKLVDPAAHAQFLETIAIEQQRLAPAVAPPPSVAPPVTAPIAPAPVLPVPQPDVPLVEAELVEAELVAPAGDPSNVPSIVPSAPALSPAPVVPLAPVAQPVAPPRSVGERAAAFAAKQATAATARPERPLPPKRSWLDWLAAFMEERNIRWGELIGGLLIVCGSIALVVSFWSAIAERPWLKFLLFNGVTAGLFGIGFYSEYRWRLRMTSQGLLSIGALLVPLNFLAIAALSSAPGADGALTIAGELISAALFAALVYYAGRILAWRDELWLAAGLLVPSLAQLLVRRFIDPDASTATLWSVAAVPVGCYLIVNFLVLRRHAAALVLGERQVNALLKFVGLTSFAVVLPLVLLLYKSGHPLEAARQIPGVASLLGLVPLSAGLLLWQKLAGRSLAALRTAGTSVAVFGAMVSLAGLPLAWPDPAAMLPTALAEFAIFTFVAWRFGLPAAHLVAAPCLALAYLLGIYLWGGALSFTDNHPLRVAATLVSGASGTLLLPVVLVYLFAAYVARTRKSAAGMLAMAAALLGAVSVGLVSWFGFAVEGDLFGAAWVYLVYAVCLLVVSARHRQPALAISGTALLAASVVECLVFRYGERLALEHAWITALLAFATLAVAIAIAVRLGGLAIEASPLPRVASSAALAASLAVSALLIWFVPSGIASYEAIHWAWLAGLWLLVALATGWLPVWTLVQLASTLALVFAVGARLETYAWFRDTRLRWLDPWTLEVLGLALAGLTLVWAIARVAARGRAQRVFESPWLCVDRATLAGLLLLVVGIASYAAVPGVLQELSPGLPRVAGVAPPRVVPAIEPFAIPGIPHEHAADWGDWALLASVLVLLALTLRVQASTWWLAAGFVAVAMSGPLVASRFESQVAAASALRWFSAGYLVLASVPIWCRTSIGRMAQRLGWPTVGLQSARGLRDLVFMLSLLPPVLMAVSIAVRAMNAYSQLPTFWNESYWLWVTWIVCLVVGAAVWSADRRQAQANWSWSLAALVIVLGTAPLLSLIMSHVGLALRQHPILGPNPDSVFARMGLAASYAAPILATAVALIGYALRERSSGFALAGGLVLNAGGSAAYVLAISQAGAAMDAGHWIRLAQLNAAIAAAYQLAWIGLAGWSRRRRGEHSEESAPRPADFAFSTQAALAPAISMLLLTWVWARLVVYPMGYNLEPVVFPQVADVWGWLSLAAVCVSAWAAVRFVGWRPSMLGVSATLTAVAILIAAVAALWDVGDWLAFNTLLVGHAMLATGFLAWAWYTRRRSADHAPPTAAWTVLQTASVLLLSAREWDWQVWWAIGGFAFVGLLLAPLGAWIFQRRRYLYLAATLVNLAGILAVDEMGGVPRFVDFVQWNVIGLALPVPVWLFIELRGIRGRDVGLHGLPVHRVVSWLAIGLIAATLAFGLYGDAIGQPTAHPILNLEWIALGLVAVAAVSCLWDVAARDTVFKLYLVGLLACGVLLDRFDLQPAWLLWTGAMVLAAYSLATSYLWSRRKGLLAIARGLGIPRALAGELSGQAWLVPANLLLVAAVVAMTVFIELNQLERSLRVLASQAALTQVVSIALLARGERRGGLQGLALALGAFAAVMFGWAWLIPGVTLTPLNALVVVSAAAAVVATLYGLGLSKLLGDTSDWLPPARRLTPWLAVTSAAALVGTLGGEVFEFSRGEVQMAWPAILTVAMTLVGLCLAALAAALLPGREPLGLSERGRTAYVYAAEIILAALFLHIRLTLPWLFTGFFEQFWPLVVLAIAYLGVGLAELFRRRQVGVLAEPLEDTGAFLPVLPVAGYWAANSTVDYSLLLMIVGVLYAGLSIARRSFGFGILAAIAANGGLWFFLHRQDGWGFLAHPQLWLIPPALCVLGAAYLNRKQLSESQMTAVRYASSIAIYVSSTADIFINGVARAPWLPIVLAGLSVLGILAGILLRVRAFLFLGTAFLALALFTIIWHAAVDLEQTWIWYACLVGLGIAILALFALFEKRRQDMLEVFHRLKQWEA